MRTVDSVRASTDSKLASPELTTRRLQLITVENCDARASPLNLTTVPDSGRPLRRERLVATPQNCARQRPPPSPGAACHIRPKGLPSGHSQTHNKQRNKSCLSQRTSPCAPVKQFKPMTIVMTYYTASSGATPRRQTSDSPCLRSFLNFTATRRGGHNRGWHLCGQPIM